MPKRELDTDDYIISETGNWNVADQYSKLKIMKPLYMADEYAEIAIFGTSSIIDDLNLQNSNIDQLKFLGFRRLIRCLITIIENSKFAIKGENDRADLKKYMDTLKNIQKSLPVLVNVRTDAIHKTREIYLEKEKYEKALEILLEIKEKINTPLNHNHLIFTDREEFDAKKFKDALKERMKSKG